MTFIYPDCFPENIKAIMTTRNGGISCDKYASLNIASHVNDNAEAVAQNRKILKQQLSLPAEPKWLNQVHGTEIIELNHNTPINLDADASLTKGQGVICAVMTADCLPVLISDTQGTIVAAVHCGWRSLAGGILQKTLDKMMIAAEETIVWFGAAIGAEAFEVGEDVRLAFTEIDPKLQTAFQTKPNNKYLADIYQLATGILNNYGIYNISGGNLCTVNDKERFYSYRRDGQTGRMASLIWIG